MLSKPIRRPPAIITATAAVFISTVSAVPALSSPPAPAYPLNLINGGQWDEALGLLNDICAANPRDYDAFYYAACCYAGRGDVETATLYFLRCLEIDAYRADAYYNLGVLAAARGRWEDAARYYRQALLAEPYRKDVNFNCGVAYLKHGEPSRAIPYLREARYLDPQDPNVIFYLALAYEDLDKKVAAAFWKAYLNATVRDADARAYRETAYAHLSALTDRGRP